MEAISINESSNTPDAIRVILDALRELSDSRVAPDPVETPVPADANEIDLTFDHWVSQIELVLPGLRVSFRTHYSSKLARRLAETTTRQSGLDPEVCQSYMTEFCNLVVGGLKNTLAEAFSSGETLNLTLPTSRPSFDTVKVLPRESREAWAYRFSDDLNLVCVARVRLSEEDLKRHFKLTAAALAEHVLNPPQIEENIFFDGLFD